jgi:eukaryotic-like serine/threonine-protein kinase
VTRSISDDSRWRQVESAFASAIELDAAARAAFLQRVLEEDPATHHELASLLDASDVTSGPLDRVPLLDTSNNEEARRAVGMRIGPWLTVDLIGQGGAGDVYLARRADGTFEQKVAVKLLRREAIGQIERFSAERQILARLEHPGIARLLDGGLAENGQPYAVVEYVEGVPIVEHCRTHALSLEQRLELFVQVCDAVAFAHRSLIVHRDLKSGNILVTPEGRVKLLDFGIAKRLDAGVWPGDERTTAPFTADYAAPEQLTGEPVTTATDVYSLGVLLFELLTDRKPWSHGGRPLARVVQSIIDQDAPVPSEVAAGRTVAREASYVPARLIVGDLDAIVAKCLRKRAADRYATVDALRTDVLRHRQHLPVSARERARLYVARLWLRRHRWAVVSAAIVFLSLTTGLLVALWQANHAKAQSLRAEAQSRLAAAEATKAAFVKDFLLDIFNTNSRQQPDPQKARNTTALQLLERAAERLKSKVPADPATNDELLSTIGSLYSDLGEVAETVELRRRRLALARQNFPSGDARISDALLDYGGALYEAEGWKDAIGLLSEADELLQKRGDTTSKTRARLDHLLGEYWRSTDLEKSRFFAGRAIDSYRRFYSNDANYVMALSSAAFTAQETDPVQAERFLRLALETHERLNLAEADRIQSLVMLAESQRVLLLSSAAERNFRQAIEITTRVNGADHIDTFQTEMRYGIFLRWTARYDDATRLLRQVEARAAALLGDGEAFHLPTIRLELGSALLSHGELRESGQWLRRALAVRERTRPNTRAHASMLLAAAEQRIATGDYSQAAAALDRADTIFAKVGVPTTFVTSKLIRARLLLAQERTIEALEVIDEFERATARARATQSFSFDSRRVAQSFALLRARALLEIAQLRTAEQLLDRPVSEAAIADRAPFFAASENERKLLLGMTYERTNRAPRAVPLLRSVLEWRRMRLSPRSPQLLEACVALSNALASTGEIADARRLAKEAEVIASRNRELGRPYRKALDALRARLATVR